MSTALRERPSGIDAGGPERRGGAHARRAIVRWSWRLFRREWRQQVLVLALVVVAVAATTVGVALASNVVPSQDADFGTAKGLMSVPGSDVTDLAAARKAFGAVEEIDHQSVAIPGSSESVDLRAQQADGIYSKPTLRLLSGHFPSGAREVAVTDRVAATFELHVGGVWRENGRTRRVVGTVENPLNLSDAFALVAPGQANPPDQITLLFDGSSYALNSFRPTGDQVMIGFRQPPNKTAAAAAILTLETIGLLFVGLVAAAGFAVMAQRRLRALGMLGALGATDRQVRLAMIANGAVVGLVGALTGAVLGLLAWIALAPHLAKLAHHRIDVVHVPWWALAAAMTLALVTAIAAAWWPARSASRASIVTALSGRPAPPKPAHRFATLGCALLLAGLLCLAFADRTTPNVFLIIAGTIATTFGMLFLGPLGIRTLAFVGRRAPIALRLSLRDLARYQARSAAALGAISLALAIAATIAVSAAALAGPLAVSNLPKREMVVHLAGNENFSVNGSDTIPAWTPNQVRTLRTAVDGLAASVHARAVVPLEQAVDPASGSFPIGTLSGGGGPAPQDRKRAVPVAIPGAPTTAVVPAALGKLRTVSGPGGRTGLILSDVVPLYVATPALLAHYGIKAADIDPRADIVTTRTGLAHLVVHAPRAVQGLGGPYQWRPTIQHVDGGRAYSSEPNAFLTPRALKAFGLQPVVSGWLIETRAPLTTPQIDAAQRSAAAVGITVERQRPQASYSRLHDGATAIGLLLALGVLAMTVGLIRSETANDLRTLAATGATSTTRRTLTGATAGALALLGALLGTGVAYLALVAWHRSDLHPLSYVPVANLVIIVVGLPLLAAAGGWLLAGREPSGLARRPLE